MFDPTSSDPVPQRLQVPTRRGFLYGAGGLSLTALLAACGSSSKGSSAAPSNGRSVSGASAKRGGTLKLGAPTPGTALDPVTMYDGSSIGIVQLVAEYLIWLDADYKLVPRLAEKWQADSANKVWTFDLRSGVTFSDGTPLDVAAVKASFDRLLDPKNKSAALSAFGGVLDQGGVTVKGSSQVVFTLLRPFSDFPYLVSAGNYNAVILKADYADDFAKNPIGTGPFLLKSADASTGATLVRNPKYWQSGKPYLDGVEVKYYADSQAEQIALQGGVIDSLIVTDASIVLPTGNLVLDKVAGTSMQALTMRVDKAPFNKKEVRQAIAFALDRPGVNQAINNNIGQVGNDHLFAPAFPDSPTDVAQRAKDTDKVKSLLSTAGIDKLSFTLTFCDETKDYAIVVQNQLKQVGIDVKLNQLTAPAFYGGDQARDSPWLFSDANLVAWAGRPVPSQFITPMVTSKGIWNGSKYSNPALDTALEAFDAATDDGGRRTQAEIIAKALNDDTPVIIAAWSGSVRVYNKSKFTGIRAHPSNYVDVTTVSQV